MKLLLKKQLNDQIQKESFHFLIDLLKKGRKIRIKADGNSMTPAVDKGDYLIVKPIQVSEIFPGDIIAFRKEGRAGPLVTHRLVKRLWSGVVTKGDANRFCDALVLFDEVYGKVIQVEKKDKIINLEGNWMRLLSFFYVKVSWLRSVLP